MQAKPKAPDFREAIRQAALPHLTADGAVIVRLVGLTGGKRGPYCVSRLYARADYGSGYDGSCKLRAVVWGRVTRMYNEDTVGANFYVVYRYSSGATVVYHDPDSILLHVAAAQAAVYGYEERTLSASHSLKHSARGNCS